MERIRNILKNLLVNHFFPSLAACYIRFVFFTSHWKTVGREIPQSYFDAKKPFILCFWHGRLGMMACCWVWKKNPIRMLLSAHKDGRLIGQTVAHFGIQSISGSTQKKGTQALREMIQTLKNGQVVGITPDGPRGPNQVASLGVITLAKLARVDMIPITFSMSRNRRLKTWDRFLLPLPFGRGVFLWGHPISPPMKGETLEMEHKRTELEQVLTALQNEADELMNHQV